MIVVHQRSTYVFCAKWPWSGGSREKMNGERWTRVKTKLDVSRSGQLSCWKCTSNEECILQNIDRVKSIALRIEDNANEAQAGRAYVGPIYIDNVVIK